MLVAAALLATAIGCGGGDASPIPVAPSGGIGPAGGTVTEASGAQVVIPANALAAATPIAVAKSPSGAPALPAGTTPVGSTYAFTPHGTAFALPVTITVPFDPAALGAGATPVLYKTNATQSAWEEVSGATASGGTMSGTVTGFSYAVVVLPAPAPVLASVHHQWLIKGFDVQGAMDIVVGISGSTDRLVEADHDFGPVYLAPTGEGGHAKSEIYANARGTTYWVSATAPSLSNFGSNPLRPKDYIGSEAKLVQTQTYRKLSDSATLQLEVSETTLEAMDFVPKPPSIKTGCESRVTFTAGLPVVYFECGNLIDTTTRFEVIATKKVQIKDGNGHVTGEGEVTLTSGAVLAHLWGYGKGAKSPFASWHYEAGPSGDSTLQFATPPKFEYDDNVDAQPDPSHARVRLAAHYFVDIPLDAVLKGEKFEVMVITAARADDRRQADSYASAKFRDPQKSSGVNVVMNGVEIVAVPVKDIVEPTIASVQPAPSCAGGTDPASGTLQFSTNSLSTFEGGADYSVPVWITRTGGGAGVVTARVSTQDGSAHAGTDYGAVSTLVRFGDGEQGQRYIELPVSNNQTLDGERTLQLVLSEAGGCAAIGSPATIRVSIVDNEVPPPATTFTLGGTVSGLAGSGLALRTASGERVTPVTNGAFTFATPLDVGAAYAVTVATQPTNPVQVCTVANGSGTIASANVTNIAVTCVTGATGALDASFGGGGKVSGTQSAARALALQPDGKLLVVGGMTLSRFNADGTADTSFGSGGKVTVVANGGGLDAMYAVTVQADGRILVAGATAVPLSNFDDIVVLRYNANGSTDTSFGTGGKSVTDFAGSTDRAYAVLVQADGKIVVTGIATLGSVVSPDQDVAVLRYLANGTLDGTFGVGGKVTTNIAGSGDFGYAAVLQADGKIVIAGRVAANGGANPDFGVARYLVSGALDPNFGTGGMVRVDFGGGVWDEAADVAIQADGKIVVGGQTAVGGSHRYALARLDSQGIRDAGFGAAGLVSTDFSGHADFGRALALQGDGRIVIAGQVSSLQNGNLGVARYLGNGTLDGAFGNAGLVSVDFFGANDDCRDVVIQADGRIVLAGSAQNGSTAGLALARVQP